MARDNRDVLSLVCPLCGVTFVSVMQVDPKTFAKIRVENMLERCSACHQAGRFQKGDYFFKRAEG